MDTGSAFDPYLPLATLKPIARDIWIVDGGEIRMGTGRLSMPFPTRMTVVRLPDGGLWVHSPIAATPALFGEIDTLGQVAHIVAPNSLHYWWVPEWHARYPAAGVHAIEGLAARAKRPLPPFAPLGDAPAPGWADAIDQHLVQGSLLTEAVFFHRASRTLILTDLIENFEPARVHSRALRWLIRLGGVADPDGKAPVDMKVSFWRHRRGVRRAAQAMIAWAPERIIIAHGRWYPSDGVNELRRAFRWVL